MTRNRRVFKRQSPIVALFAKNLKETRRKRGVSQTKLAAKSGVNLSYIGRIERQETTPGLDICDSLSQGLGMSLSELLRLEEKPRDPLPVLRQQANANIQNAMAKADRPVLETIAMLGNLIEKAVSKNY